MTFERYKKGCHLRQPFYLELEVEQIGEEIAHALKERLDIFT